MMWLSFIVNPYCFPYTTLSNQGSLKSIRDQVDHKESCAKFWNSFSRKVGTEKHFIKQQKASQLSVIKEFSEAQINLGIPALQYHIPYLSDLPQQDLSNSL